MQKLAIVNNDTKGLLNVNEAAIKLGVSPKTIRKWQHEGKLPYVKLFGAVRFDFHDLERLIRQSRVSKEIN